MRLVGGNPAPFFMAFLSHLCHLLGLQEKTESRRAVLKGQPSEDINCVYGRFQAFTPVLQLLLCVRAPASAKLYGAAWKLPCSGASRLLTVTIHNMASGVHHLHKGLHRRRESAAAAEGMYLTF